jgi:hypothetical protein
VCVCEREREEKKVKRKPEVERKATIIGGGRVGSGRQHYSGIARLMNESAWLGLVHWSICRQGYGRGQVLGLAVSLALGQAWAISLWPLSAKTTKEQEAEARKEAPQVSKILPSCFAPVMRSLEYQLKCGSTTGG